MVHLDAGVNVVEAELGAEAEGEAGKEGGDQLAPADRDGGHLYLLPQGGGKGLQDAVQQQGFVVKGRVVLVQVEEMCVDVVKHAGQQVSSLAGAGKRRCSHKGIGGDGQRRADRRLLMGWM